MHTLNPLFNCFAKLALSLEDKKTIGTCNLVSVITNFGVLPALDIIKSNLIQGKLHNLLMAFLMISKITQIL